MADAFAASASQPVYRTGTQPTLIMLSWSIAFLIIAILAGLLGFTGIAGTAVGFAKILFLLFLVLFIVSLLFGRRPPAA